KSELRTALFAMLVDNVEAETNYKVKVGAWVLIKAYMSNAGLQPQVVQVKLNCGRISDDDDLTEVHTIRMEHVETFEAGRHQFQASCEVSEAGPFGYTVWLVPVHPAMATSAELGLIARPYNGTGGPAGTPPLFPPQQRTGDIRDRDFGEPRIRERLRRALDLAAVRALHARVAHALDRSRARVRFLHIVSGGVRLRFVHVPLVGVAVAEEDVGVEYEPGKKQ